MQQHMHLQRGRAPAAAPRVARQSSRAAAAASSSPAPQRRDAPAGCSYRVRRDTRAAAAGGTAFDLNCEHFERCSGCTLSTALDNPPVLSEAKEFYARLGVPDFTLTTLSASAWRNKARLAARADRDGKLALGLFEAGSHEIVDIVPGCKAHHPRVNEAAALVREVAREMGVLPYDERTGKGELRYCQLATVGTEADAPVQLTLVWAGDSVDSAGDASDAAPQSKWRQSGSAETTASAPAAAAADPATRAMRDRHPRLSKLADALWTRANGAPGEPGADPRNLNPNSTPLLHSVWGNLHSAPGNAVVGRDGDAAWALLHGERWHWEAFAGADVAFSPGAFLQANYAAFDALLRRVAEAVPTGSRVAELYAGSGAIGLSLVASGRASSLTCIEVTPEALPPFKLARAKLPQQSVTVSVEMQIVSAGSAAAIRAAAGAEVLVVDPPRRGLDSELLDWLCGIDPPGTSTAAPPQQSVALSSPPRPPNATSQEQSAAAPAAAPLSAAARRRLRKKRTQAKLQLLAGGGAAASSDDDDAASLEDSQQGPAAASMQGRQQQQQQKQPGGGASGGVARSAVRRLVYVSCGWAALRREAPLLVGSGLWRLASASGFQFFPGTDAMETVNCFERVLGPAE